MKLNPYLTFNGQCEQAFKYYEKCLGGRITMIMTYGESPMASQMPPGFENKILHATLALGEQVIGGADAPPASYREPQGFSVTLNIDGAQDAERIFGLLASGGEVQFAIQETFWALRFGMLVDQFGTPWMINCGKAI